MYGASKNEQKCKILRTICPSMTDCTGILGFIRKMSLFADSLLKVRLHNRNRPVHSTGVIVLEANFTIIGRKRTSKILLYASQRVCLIHIRITIVGVIWAKLLAFEVDELEFCQFSDEVIAAYAIWYKSYTMRTIIHKLYWNITSI